MRGLMALSVAITCGFALFIIVYVLCKGLPNITWQLLSTGLSGYLKPEEPKKSGGD
jgi:phosphate transport system permease protein